MKLFQDNKKSRQSGDHHKPKLILVYLRPMTLRPALSDSLPLSTFLLFTVYLVFRNYRNLF